MNKSYYYQTWQNPSNNFHTVSYCWSHIISDAKELEEFYGDEGKRIKESLQKVYEEAKSFDGHGSRGDVDHLYERLTFLLDVLPLLFGH